MGLRGQDIRQSIRSLARQPALAMAAVATIALGVGANTAVFSIVDSVLISPLPFEAPEQLAMLWAADRTRGNDYLRVSEEDAERLTALDGITASVAMENFGLLLLNAIVLLGQLWPAGAPPFARTANIVCLVCNLAYIGHRTFKS